VSEATTREEARQVGQQVLIRVDDQSVGRFWGLLRDRLEQTRVGDKNIAQKIENLIQEFHQLVDLSTRHYRIPWSSMIPLETLEDAIRVRIASIGSMIAQLIDSLASEAIDRIERAYSSSEGGVMSERDLNDIVKYVADIISVIKMSPVLFIESVLTMVGVLSMNADLQKRPGLGRFISGVDILSERGAEE